MESLFKSSFIEISYSPDNRWLYCNWQDHQTMESIQTGCEQILVHLINRKCTKILNDNRLVKGTWSFATDWVSNTWFPRAIEGGLKYFAWIYSPDAFSRFSADKVSRDEPNEVIHAFKDITEGENWLKAL